VARNPMEFRLILHAAGANTESTPQFAMERLAEGGSHIVGRRVDSW
jgi:hypothetical protein